MSPTRSRRWATGTFAVATMMLALAGCDGCPVADFTSGPASPDDLDGRWHVDSYTFDDQGCEPQPSDSPFDALVVESPDASSDRSKFHLLFCPSSGNCPDTAAPENRLLWQPDYLRGETSYYSAGLVDSNRRHNLCRLTSIQTLLVPEGRRLDMTRSHYELTLPMEGDEACNTELAEEYSAQLNCARSEHVQLVQPDDQQALAEE